MQRVQINGNTAISLGASTPVMISIEGGGCRLYTGAAPSDQLAGHLVSGGYQIVIPAGLSVYASAVDGAAVAAVVGPFGV